MALTLAQARAQWVANNPFPVIVEVDGAHVPTSQAEYDAMADDRAASLVTQSIQADADAARTLLRKKYRAAKTITTSPVGTTAADVRTAVVQHRAILDGLLEVLKDAALILDD
jgi:hypothetical protein